MSGCSPLPMLASCAALQLCQVVLPWLSSGCESKGSQGSQESVRKDTVPAALSQLNQTGKCWAGEPSLALTLPSNAPATPWLCAISSLQFSSASPTRRGVSAKIRGPRIMCCLSTPTPGRTMGCLAPRSSCSHSGPWVHQPHPCLASGLCSGENEMCYLFIIEKGTKCLILTFDRQIRRGAMARVHTHPYLICF